jgi:hypothetical protein
LGIIFASFNLAITEEYRISIPLLCIGILGFSQDYSVEVSSSTMDYSVHGSTVHVGNIATTAGS